MMFSPKFVEAIPQADAVLLVRYADGAQRLFDVKPYLDCDFFSRLADESHFKQVRSAGSTVVWPEGQDVDRISPYFARVPLKGVTVSKVTPSGCGVTLTTGASPEESAAMNGNLTTPAGEA